MVCKEHHGLVRALSYIIQAISAEPGLGPKLSQAIPSKIAIPAKWATQGTLADFFVTVRELKNDLFNVRTDNQ